MAYSSESWSAASEAAMMFASAPAVSHVPVSCPVSMITRVRAAGGRLAVEDADLVVDQVHLVERGVERAQRLAQRQVERVDRPVAVGGGVQHLAVDLDLDAGLGARRCARCGARRSP